MEVSEASHKCHLGPLSSLSLERWFQHLKHQGEEGADGRRTAELRVVTKLLDGRTLKTRGQRALAGDSSRKASPLRLPERGELQGDCQVSKPLVWGRRHSPAQENLGPRRWSWYGWMDAPGMLSSSLSLTVALSLRGSRPPPCEEPGPFLTSKPAASLASPHDPACNLLTEGRQVLGLNTNASAAAGPWLGSAVGPSYLRPLSRPSLTPFESSSTEIQAMCGHLQLTA
ncbi:hypothetical protein CapIbe_022254 [Capra ibex]